MPLRGVWVGKILADHAEALGPILFHVAEAMSIERKVRWATAFSKCAEEVVWVFVVLEDVI